MNLLIVLAVVAVFGLLRFRRANLLMWAGAWWVGIYVLLRFGFTAPIPASVVSLYMAIVSIAILAYVSSSQERRDEVSGPLVRFMTDKRYTALLGATVVAIPALAAANVYVQMNVPLQPPLFSRSVHPASPSEITVHDKKIDLDAGENPFAHLQTSNPEQFRKHVENGRQVYYRNCVFCHGDNLSGNGMFAHGLDPIPTNFADRGTISQLARHVSVLADLQGRPGASRGRGAVGLGHAGLGEVPEGRRDLGGDSLSLRFHRPEASRPGGARREMTSCLTRRALGCLAVLLASLCAARMGSVRAQAPDVGTEAQRESGKTIYLKYCSQCHGEKGDGEGSAATHLRPRPRNFTTGMFKVRTTPNGALPTHQDLVNIIRRGMPYTSMPAWPELSDQDVSNLAYFIKTFSPEFSNPAGAPQPVPLPSAPRATKESIALGKKLYEETGCVKCHGTLGRGDGSSAPTLKDDWGHPIRAADLAQSWTFRGGSSREDIFRTMSTGFNGAPMPSFADSLTPEQRWAITDFIASLSDSDGPGYSNLVVAKHVQDPIDLAEGGRELRLRACGPLPDRRADHGAGTRVPSARDERRRSGDLRRGLHRPPRSMARHERRESREERAVASRAPGRGGGASDWRSRGQGGLWRGSRPDAGQAGAGPLCRGGTGRPVIGILRRGRDPDSVAGADGRPETLFHLRRRPEPGGSLVLRSGES